MRKIEEQMLDAVRYGVEWSNGNTSVNPTENGNEVFLYGHLIATVKSNKEVLVNTAVLRQFPTITTKSRLRALGVAVTTKKGVTYLDGEAI